MDRSRGGAAAGAAAGAVRRTGSGGEAGGAGGSGSGGATAAARSADPLPSAVADLRLQGAAGEDEGREAVYEAIHFEGNPQECGHVVTTACVRNGTRHVLRYSAERVVGNGSFGVVFQATCVESRETVAIKRVLQDKRFKNRELQIMRLLDHPNVVKLKQSFYSTADREEVYLNLVLEFVPDTVYRIIKHYAKRAQVSAARARVAGKRIGAGARAAARQRAPPAWPHARARAGQPAPRAQRRPGGRRAGRAAPCAHRPTRSPNSHTHTRLIHNPRPAPARLPHSACRTCT
jgi:hypothetical protein